MSSSANRSQSVRLSDAAAERTAILVLGMHRSGTSALTGTLILLGARQPATLMEPLEANPRGYWESRPFCDFHDHLLQAGGTCWDQWTRFQLDRIGVDTTARLREEFVHLLSHEFGDAPLFVVKEGQGQGLKAPAG